MTINRVDVEFKTDDGVILRGWWFNGGEGKRPTIVMAHGYSAVKEMYLDNFANVFSANGFHCLVYDNRCLGASDGEPRQEIDPWQQIKDYRDAITYASSRPDVDASKIGVWGSSYSGAHVLVVAAIDRRVKCVVSQVPLVAGLENARRLVRSDMFPVFRKMFEDDRVNRYNGGKPAMVPVVNKDPAGPAALPTADSTEFFLRETDTRWPSWRNECTLRSVEMFTEYEPWPFIPNIAPTPLMMVVAAGDILTVSDLALKAYNTALEPKKLVVLNGGHFEAYTNEPFKKSSAEQLAWFKAHLA